MPWRRKIEAGGAWWAQAGDGSWSRWDDLRGDWVAELTGPPGGAPDPAPQGAVYAPPVPARLRPLRIAHEFAVTWGRLMLPGAITIGLALAVVVPLALISNLFFFFFDHPVRIGPTLGYMFASVVGVTLFLAAGGTMLRVARSLAWQIAAGMVLLAGPLITVYLVARLLDTSMGELLMRREAVVTTVLILVGYGASAWLRFARSG